MFKTRRSNVRERSLESRISSSKRGIEQKDWMRRVSLCWSIKLKSYGSYEATVKIKGGSEGGNGYPSTHSAVPELPPDSRWPEVRNKRKRRERETKAMRLGCSRAWKGIENRNRDESSSFPRKTRNSPHFLGRRRQFRSTFPPFLRQSSRHLPWKITLDDRFSRWVAVRTSFGYQGKQKKKEQTGRGTGRIHESNRATSQKWILK